MTLSGWIDLRERGKLGLIWKIWGLRPLEAEIRVAFWLAS